MSDRLTQIRARLEASKRGSMGWCPMTGYPVIILTNRKDKYLPAALDSLKNLTGMSGLLIVDDTGDKDWREWLNVQGHQVYAVMDKPAGYTTAMQTVWQIARVFESHVFFLEEDFTIDVPIRLGLLATILDSDPTLTQVALQRQPWYDGEKEHGLIGAQREQGRTFTDKDGWIRHDGGFTGNPSLIAESAFYFDWPGQEWSEFGISERMRDAGRFFAYWGAEGDQHVTHHGHDRADSSHGY